ncbi:hypothetical protein CFN78_04860 [Amycolatopsis antarctica]|uniref:Mycothiol-dependent maleylpyruvate isomerase metal-binding domain-containing protein n=1 Tax=Amycolatopsis antarctica TaxID=1854586 RepID=A0A263D7U0_9PSEU|nr:maleylpyruvate isomerase family mycothiol-dependent enzyme [Amycolatopsis antarctica]OZM74451.1 hypothetical protein CFN78_04860 [Amycolatopsis antarctica]
MRGQALVDHGRLLEVLGMEGELLGEITHAVQPDIPVTTCPGWTTGELLRHVGSVYRVALGWLADGRQPTEWQREPVRGQTLEEYLETGYAALFAELSRHDPGERAGSWWPADRTYGFWCRRMVHETVVHRVDAQQAATPDQVSPVDEDIAADGADEALALWFAQRLPMLGLTGTRAGSVGVRAGGHNWIARAGPAETTAWRCSPAEAEMADGFVSGTAEKVYLWMWGRQPWWSVTLDGHDDDAVGQLWALLRLATR